MLEHLNHYVYAILLLIGLHAMIVKNNLVKKLIGMSIFQTAIILFFVSLGVKADATIPILEHHHDHHTHQASANGTHDSDHGEDGVESSHGDHAKHHSSAIDADAYANPVPHVLMLTAIVVGVSTLGVGLAICQLVFYHYGSIEEDEIFEQIQSSDG